MTNYSALHYSEKARKCAEEAQALLESTLNDTQITNCITEIPQDIKLELNNGVLTLKAGSKVYVPNGKNSDGSNKFDVVTAITDINYSGSANNDTIMLDVGYNTSTFEITTIHGNALNFQFSGNTPPTTGLFYNTTDNTIKLYSSGSVNRYGSFPIAIINRSSTSQGSGFVKSVDQVFNGFGYIGSTIFALPGVKGLTPNGRNEDGTLKNIEFTVGSVKTFSYNYAGSYNIVLDNNNLLYNGLYRYSDKENINYDGTGKQYLCNIGTCDTASNGFISNWKLKTTFHAVDYNDKETIVGWGIPDYTAIVSITSPYTAPSNGFIQYNHSANQNGKPTIDGINVDDSPTAGNNYDSLYLLFPIAKNSIFTFPQNIAKFIPCIGG